MYNQAEDLELDEMWSFVLTKKNQRWLWLAVNHDNGDIIAYTFGKRQDEVFLAFQQLLDPLGFRMFYTDGWSSYDYIPEEKHIVGKRNTQTIERKNLTLRTRIKRLTRKTICYSKSIFMHDTVIGLVINILAFGWFESCLNLQV
jgi:insertion element IS1 protein InsB